MRRPFVIRRRPADAPLGRAPGRTPGNAVTRRFVMASVAAMLTLGFWGPGFAGSPPLTLTVASSQSSYGASDEIALTVTLQNTSGSPVTASIYAPGNLRLKLKRDGGRVAPLKTIIHFDDDPREVRVQELMTLAPGQMVPIPFTVRPDRAITQVKLARKGGHKAVVYSLSAPGVYTLSLAYKYTGPDTGQPGLFRGKTLKSNEISFSVL